LKKQKISEKTAIVTKTSEDEETGEITEEKSEHVEESKYIKHFQLIYISFSHLISHLSTG
jgi:hypothetical protein